MRVAAWKSVMLLSKTLSGLLLLNLAVACGGDLDDPAPLPLVEVSWSPCPLISGDTVLDAECASVAVPADYDAPEGPTIIVSVKRRLVANSEGQLWLLQGGPGGSVTDFEPVVDAFALRDDLDVYMLEHRGVGASSGLFCPTQEAANSPSAQGIEVSEVSDCVDYLEGIHGSLDAFTTTGAAYDLATLIESTRPPDDQVFVYGVSYGTYWLHRYSQVAPDQADGLIFDSICAPGQCQLGYSWAKGFDEVGRQILDRCTLDVTCGSRLPDPVGAIEAVYADLDAGHCPGLGLEGGEVSSALARAIRIRELQPYLAAAVYRIQRCTEQDVAALETFFTLINEKLGRPRTAPASTVLALQVGLSELYAKPTSEQLSELDSWILMASDVAAGSEMFDVWPRYQPDQFYDSMTETAVPALLLQGDFDPQTPPRVATNLRDRLTGPGQTYVQVPFSAHNVVMSSRIEGSNETCGQELMGQFLSAPDAPLDTSCTTATLGLDFMGSPALNQTLFGSDDMWD